MVRLLPILLITALLGPTVGVQSAAAEEVRKKVPLVVTFGFEGAWGALHPGGDALSETYAAYGYDQSFSGLFNFNLVAEFLYAGNPWVETGLHFGYNGLIEQTLEQEIYVGGYEIGVAARFLMTPPDVKAATAFRLEGGFMFADFKLGAASDEYKVPFIRPAFSFFAPAGQSGAEMTFGWTFARAPDGLGKGYPLPLGGMDVGLLFRIAP